MILFLICMRTSAYLFAVCPKRPTEGLSQAQINLQGVQFVNDCLTVFGAVRLSQEVASSEALALEGHLVRSLAGRWFFLARLLSPAKSPNKARWKVWSWLLPF